MERGAEAQGSEEGNSGNNSSDKSDSHVASPKEDSNPVVYKLVRVDFDGRLVPATDDELMEVEGFLDYENSDIFSVEDDVQTSECRFDEDVFCHKPSSDEDEGLLQQIGSQADVKQSNTSVKYADEMVMGVKEQGLNSACGSLFHPPADGNVGHQSPVLSDQRPKEDQKLLSKIPVIEILPSSSSILHDRTSILSGNTLENSKAQNESIISGPHASTASSDEKPNFSLLRGEIDLDNLTIRELHEAFKATFGRETSVKDKLWLKRRIAMGLANSCDIPLTGYIVKDYKLAKKVQDAGSKGVDVLDSSAGARNEDSRYVALVCDDENVGVEIAWEFKSPRTSDYSITDGLHEQRGAKRARKPTKRYIEEADRGCEGPVVSGSSLIKHHVKQKNFLKPAVKSSLGFQSSLVSTRTDSFGGSGVQVPYVSRIRRCRPRRSIISLADCESLRKVQSSRMDLQIQLAKDAAEVCKSQIQTSSNIVEDRTVPVELPLVNDNNGSPDTAVIPAKVVQEQNLPEPVDASGNHSDTNVASEFTAKGGVRRKHHRAWSLTEVVKLVDGVSRYGAGRWSEIKRLAFASYSYRTSVDLKDKWRNLLKASFATVSSEKGAMPRKPGSIPIPAPILLKVRELAEINGQVPPKSSVERWQSCK